ncbi:EexN family lipoprotein [Salmonella enterica]|nr:EexN family lipoprotein [Salmonella enterica]EKP2190273.1 EexN family lipoprotein [Salmonella enterica]EKP2199777.1 EexN family lipoprotein [Salmonella enterica]
MKKIATIASALIICLSMTGCDDKTSVEWYVKHHEDMFSKYSGCLLADSWHEISCQNVRSAMNLEKDKPDVQEGRANARQKLMDRED